MALTNHDRVGKAMELLKAGLGPYVEREFTNAFKDRASDEAKLRLSSDRAFAQQTFSDYDAAALLRLIWESWNDVFKQGLGYSARSLVSELRDFRNHWAHQKTFSGDDVYRVFDSGARLLTAVSAPQAEDMEKLKAELLRLRFDEQVRGEKRKSAGSAIESSVTGQLKPWREVVTPHKDVASGMYQSAEFAADLWQVYQGQGSDEYRDPAEFYRRTYLTESLKGMLVGAVRRLTGGQGDPVIQLQTNFGGGKTHSMLALYHLFSGGNPKNLLGVDAILSEAGVEKVPTAKRVVLVGTQISAGNPSVKADGTVVKTLWGELAYQLGGKEAFSRVAGDDAAATNPGHVLTELFNEYSPCLILIDEWVAYARQLHFKKDLAGGGFETQFTFAQALTESAMAAKNCLLVVSLPASDTTGSPHSIADDSEVGGERGREALDRLKNVVARVESSWRPATAEEGFEIVRRRLFEPISDPAHFKERDIVARAFYDSYRTQQAEFPTECGSPDYEKRIKAAYPIHPEIFDRLYSDWSSLIKFQRTRGVLRLMAAVIHSLWEKGDKNPLILPANISIDDPRVQAELTRYLPDNWAPVIGQDVDGPGSLPLKLDSEVPNLGKYSASRRVARTIYLGSAPKTAATHRGIEDRRIKLGSVMPGESPSVFGDALRRLAATATYLYQDGSSYWFSTQPTVAKMAEDRASLLKREPDKVFHELEKRIRDDVRRIGDFSRVHPLPRTGQDVPDDLDARLVVLGSDYPFAREPVQNAALVQAKQILESRGNAPRLYRNTLVFLAPDKARMQDLEDVTCKYLAWKSILAEREALNIDPQQVIQAENQERNADLAVSSQLPETYQWLLVPTQKTAQGEVTWDYLRLSGKEPLAERASKKLKGEEQLITRFAASRLRMELDRIPLWRGDHVTIRQLIEDFARYPYLPRLKGPSVLTNAISDGVALISWDKDAFGFADSYDDAGMRYRGLRGGEHVAMIDPDSQALLVKPSIASAQLSAMQAERSQATINPQTEAASGSLFAGGSPEPTPKSSTASPKRFYGTVVLDPTRIGRDAGKIAEEVVAHLEGIVGAKVTVTLDIQAEIPSGVSEQIVRTVTENSRTLKFTTQGFEKE